MQPPEPSLREHCIAAACDPGSVHRVSMQSLQGLSVWRVKGDGKCLWYALAAGAAFCDGASLEEVERMDRAGEIAGAARAVRRCVCRRLQDAETGGLRAEFLPFWAPGEEGTGDVEDSAAYLRGLCSGSVFGGELELKVAAEVAKRTIAVLNVSDHGSRHVYLTVYRPETIRGCVSPILLLRQGLHYDAAHRRAPPRSKTPSPRLRARDELPRIRSASVTRSRLGSRRASTSYF